MMSGLRMYCQQKGVCNKTGMIRPIKSIEGHYGDIPAASGLETIVFSAGKIGYQVEMKPEDLKKIIRYELKELTVKPDVS